MLFLTVLSAGLVISLPASAQDGDVPGIIPADTVPAARMLSLSPEPGDIVDSDLLVRNDTLPAYDAVLIVPVQETAVVSGGAGARAVVHPGTVRVMPAASVNYHTGAVLSREEAAGLPLAEILGQDDRVLYSTHFGYQNLITVPMRAPGTPADAVPAVISTSRETTLVLPCPADAFRLRFRDETGRITGTVLIDREHLQNISTSADPRISKSRSSPSGTLNILILASGYSSATVNGFTTRAGLVKQKLLAAAPFSTYGSKVSVTIHADTTDLGCYSGCYSIDRLMCCDSAKVFAEAQSSGFLYDEIIVIHNTGTYAGGGAREGGTLAYKTNSYSSYCMVYDGEYTAPMVLHEFGHSFGDLCDEYTYGSEGYSYYPCVNCKSSCSVWSALSSTCTQSCDARADYYRPDTSIMLDLTSSTIYNQPSIYASYTPDGLKKRTDFFTTVPVTAAFSGSPTTGSPPLTVSFTDHSTGSPASWLWIFGDGSSSTEQNPLHTYTKAGLYSVSLTAANAAGGDIAVRNGYIAVAGIPPKADFLATPRSGLRPMTVRFTDLSTGSPASWRWTFGDGSSVNASKQNPVHTYSRAGKYRVTLKAVNAYGNTTLTRARYITVRTTSKAGVFRPSAARFILKNGSATTRVTWGRSTDLPITGDWNGDGLFDVGIFRPSAARFILKNGSATTNVTWGRSTDLPITGDWNGDGLFDVGVYRPSSSQFILKNGTGIKIQTWGRSGDLPVTGDWDGNGFTDIGVFRPSERKFILRNGSRTTNVSWGTGTDRPVTGDWNGDGLYDIGVFRPSAATFILKNGTLRTTVVLGTATDKPVTGMWN